MGVVRKIHTVSMRVLSLGLFLYLTVVVSCGKKKNNKKVVGSSGNHHGGHGEDCFIQENLIEEIETQTQCSESHKTECTTSYNKECSLETETTYEQQCTVETVKEPVSTCAPDVQEVCTAAIGTNIKKECTTSLTSDKHCYYSRKKRDTKKNIEIISSDLLVPLPSSFTYPTKQIVPNESSKKIHPNTKSGGSKKKQPTSEPSPSALMSLKCHVVPQKNM